MDKGEGVFNGDTGIIRSINSFAETMEVEFDERRMVEYSFKQLEELELAYAVTIHKSQGSEYPAVVIPLLSGPKMLMTRNLLYTAVTRAKQCVQMLGRDLSFQKLEEELRDLLRKYSGTEAVHGACRPDPGAVGGRRILKTIYGISHGEEACLYAK